MMISPETFYDVNLKGKNKTQLRSIIRNLQGQIEKLKETMEHPEYGEAGIQSPSEEVQISCNREYLRYAIQALEELGVVYLPTKKERKSLEFQENLPFLSKITYEIGGCFDELTRYELIFEDEVVKIISPYLKVVQEERTVDKDGLLSLLADLYIGEWLEYYSPERFGYFILDGTQWSVTFEYFNGQKTVEYGGSNSYPYNFEEFSQIFDVIL